MPWQVNHSASTAMTSNDQTTRTSGSTTQNEAFATDDYTLATRFHDALSDSDPGRVATQDDNSYDLPPNPQNLQSPALSGSSYISSPQPPQNWNYAARWGSDGSPPMPAYGPLPRYPAEIAPYDNSISTAVHHEVPTTWVPAQYQPPFREDRHAVQRAWYYDNYTDANLPSGASEQSGVQWSSSQEQRGGSWPHDSAGVIRRERGSMPSNEPYPAPQSHIPPPRLTQRASISQFPEHTSPSESFTSTSPSASSSQPLAPDNSEWRLTPVVYQWLFAVMYPKRRPDKSQPTPTGPCLLCDTVCKRPGILQQHLIIVHRQRIARKLHGGQRFSFELALAFVVAQIRSVPNREYSLLEGECDLFCGTLENNPGGLAALGHDELPLLRQKLNEFARDESWIGVQCQLCGVWATRPVAMEEHLLVCARNKPPDEESASVHLNAPGGY